jgi:hypothetical protein
MNDGVASLKALKNPPRIFRLHPSQILDFMMLSFRSDYCAAAVNQGVSDANNFLASPDQSKV